MLICHLPNLKIEIYKRYELLLNPLHRQISFILQKTEYKHKKMLEQFTES